MYPRHSFKMLTLDFAYIPYGPSDQAPNFEVAGIIIIIYAVHKRVHKTWHPRGGRTH